MLSTDLIDLINAEIRRSREKYPGSLMLNLALQGEIGGLAEAQLLPSHHQTIHEAVQCIALLVRIIREGDSSVTAFHDSKRV